MGDPSVRGNPSPYKCEHWINSDVHNEGYFWISDRYLQGFLVPQEHTSLYVMYSAVATYDFRLEHGRGNYGAPVSIS